MLEGMGRERRVGFPPRCHIWCVFGTLSPFRSSPCRLDALGVRGFRPRPAVPSRESPDTLGRRRRAAQRKGERFRQAKSDAFGQAPCWGRLAGAAFPRAACRARHAVPSRIRRFSPLPPHSPPSACTMAPGAAPSGTWGLLGTA